MCVCIYLFIILIKKKKNIYLNTYLNIYPIII